jgi:hypothetical protein
MGLDVYNDRNLEEREVGLVVRATHIWAGSFRV